ncbi:UNVERIFIED_ORG: hypothetical protein ABIB13_002244 [Arthrobacter sp. UYEF2]
MTNKHCPAPDPELALMYRQGITSPKMAWPWTPKPTPGYGTPMVLPWLLSPGKPPRGSGT